MIPCRSGVVALYTHPMRRPGDGVGWSKVKMIIFYSLKPLHTTKRLKSTFHTAMIPESM